MPEPVRDFLSDADGEWAIVNGDFAQIAGQEAIPQGIRIRLGMFLGECYLDESAGVDYETILQKGTDRLLIRALLQAEIVKTPDVIRAIGAELIRDTATREASIDFAVDTTYSEEPLTGQQAVL